MNVLAARMRLGGWLVVALLSSAFAAACNGSDSPDGMGGQGGDAPLAGDGNTATGGQAGGPGVGGLSSVGSAPGVGGTSSSGGASGITGGGLVLDVLKIDVSSKGVAKVEFTISDADGRPLDREGKITYGAVAPNFILSWLGVDEEGESTQYTAYTLRTKTTTDGDSAKQSSYDTGGSYEAIALGHYVYTLGTKIDITNERKGLTHSLGVYATREVAGVRFVATDVESWVPSGGDVKTVLDVVTTEACNSCHTRLEAHGGARRGVEMCHLCHTESNSINPESGNTIDFQVMIHKIHRGKDLPSVVAGDPYYFIGFGGSTEDFSDVAYPWDMKDCAKCHQGSQGDRWFTRPAMKPCTSCHDRTYFGTGDTPEGWTKHTAGPRDDSECIVCHASDSLEPITTSHLTSLSDPDRPIVTAKILSVTNTAPGQTPKVELELSLDGEPVDILSQRPNRLRLRIFGPTSDVNRSWSETIEDASTSAPVAAVECGSTPTPPCLEPSGDGFIFHAATPIPADVKGSFIAALDGRIADPTYGNIAFVNPNLTFAITGEVIARRAIVDLEHCNSCHGDLGLHGGNYKDPLYCLNCHNTTATFPVETAPAPGESVVEAAMNLKDFIHSLHSSVAYPSPLDVCERCHLPGTYGVPLTQGLLASKYGKVTCPEGAATCAEGMGGAPTVPDLVTSYLPPESAACVTCHSDPAAIAHAQTNTAPAGEACATCHGAGKAYDVTMIHGLEP
jgi:OmcA/MtrC family decaheme c-type cytochrome